MITALEAIRLAKEIGGKDGLNCIAELDETAVAEQTECSENAPLPLLFGVPVLVKDNIDVKGFHTTAGSLALEDNIAQNDAPIIRNLRRNGAVIIGKSNMTEFANFVSTKMPGGYSSRGGQVIHAVKPELDPLGSSTGSAVAVAAGIVPMAIGTDTCHSVTACAMGNGICGLKPPAGVLSQEGIIPISKTFDSAGAMAQNVRDTLKLYSAMRDEPLPEIKPAPAGGLRIAVNTANSDMNPEERKQFLDKVVETLKNSGAEVSEVDEPPTPELPAIMKREFGPGLAEYLGKNMAKLKTLKEIVEYFEAHPDTMMKYGYDLLHGALYDESQEDVVEEEYQKAMKSRADQIKKVTEEIKDYDAVLITGPTYVNHLCGLPTITVASGSLDSNGVRQAIMLYGTDEYTDDLVQMLQAREAVMLTGAQLGPVQAGGQLFIKDLVDEAGFSAAGDAGHADEGPQGQPHVDAPQIVLPAAEDLQEMAVAAAPRFGYGDRPLSGEVLSRQGAGLGHDVVQGAGGHDLAAVDARAGAHVHDEIRRADGLLVMLHHQKGVADVPQIPKGGKQPGVVPLVQADGRLVQDIQNAHEAGTDLGGQADALALAAGQGARPAAEGEIVQAHVPQELEPGPDLPQNGLADDGLGAFEVKLFQKFQGFRHRKIAELSDPEAAHGHRP